MVVRLALVITFAACGAKAPGTTSAGPGKADQRAAAMAVMKFLESGDATAVRAHFKTNVTYNVSCSVCDDAAVPAPATPVAGAALLDQLVATIKAANADGGIGGFVTGDDVTCEKDCCAVVREGGLQHNHLFFDKVCFQPATDQVISLDVTDGG